MAGNVLNRNRGARDSQRYPDGDKRNCPECGAGMKPIHTFEDDMGLWQCPACKTVDVIPL